MHSSGQWSTSQRRTLGLDNVVHVLETIYKTCFEPLKPLCNESDQLFEQLFESQTEPSLKDQTLQQQTVTKVRSVRGEKPLKNLGKNTDSKIV